MLVKFSAVMKIRIIITVFLIILFASASAFADTARVITKENAIRNDCKFFSPVKVKLKYNDEVEVISKEGDWFKVKYKDKTGCIHKSAVEEKSVSLSGVFGSKKQASSDEVALAGKGFNPQVESSYKNKHPEMNFNAVDSVEKYKVSEERLSKFIKDGGLKQP